MPQLSVMHSSSGQQRAEAYQTKLKEALRAFLMLLSTPMVPLNSTRPHQLHLEEQEGWGVEKNGDETKGEWDAGMKKREDCSLVSGAPLHIPRWDATMRSKSKHIICCSLHAPSQARPSSDSLVVTLFLAGAQDISVLWKYAVLRILNIMTRDSSEQHVFDWAPWLQHHFNF